jgi:hypothetical protein
MVLHTRIPSVIWRVVPFVAAVQRHSLTPSTWTTWTWLVRNPWLHWLLTMLRTTFVTMVTFITVGTSIRLGTCIYPSTQVTDVTCAIHRDQILMKASEFLRYEYISYFFLFSNSWITLSQNLVPMNQASGICDLATVIWFQKYFTCQPSQIFEMSLYDGSTSDRHPSCTAFMCITVSCKPGVLIGVAPRCKLLKCMASRHATLKRVIQTIKKFCCLKPKDSSLWSQNHVSVLFPDTV